MKNCLIIITTVVLTVTACDKESSIIDNPTSFTDTIDFEITSTYDTAYLYQEISFSINAEDSVIDNKDYRFLWSIDGNHFKGGENIECTFSTEGTHSIVLIVNSQKRTKTIQIHPGMISYRIMNLSRINLELTCYVDNPLDYGNSQIRVNSGHLSEPVFSNCINFPYSFNLMGINLFYNGTKYQYQPNNSYVKIRIFQENLIELRDTSTFIKTLSTAEGPDKIKLYELL